MTKPGRITIADWQRRYGWPEPPGYVRDDPPDGATVADLEYYSHAGTGGYRLTTPSAAEIERAGYPAEPDPGDRYVRLAVPVERNSVWWISAVVFPVPCASVGALNRASNTELMAFYQKVIGHGGKADLIGKLPRHRDWWS